MQKFVSLDYLKQKGHFWIAEGTDNTRVMDIKILDNIPPEALYETTSMDGEICRNCGKRIISNYLNFCPNCGAPFTKKSEEIE